MRTLIMTNSNFDDANKIWHQIKVNREALNNCKQHSFVVPDAPLPFKLKLKCSNCGGWMDAIQAMEYARGWKAAGRDPNEIIPDFEIRV